MCNKVSNCYYNNPFFFRYGSDMILLIDIVNHIDIKINIEKYCCQRNFLVKSKTKDQKRYYNNTNGVNCRSWLTRRHTNILLVPLRIIVA